MTSNPGIEPRPRWGMASAPNSVPNPLQRDCLDEVEMYRLSVSGYVYFSSIVLQCVNFSTGLMCMQFIIAAAACFQFLSISLIYVFIHSDFSGDLFIYLLVPWTSFYGLSHVYQQGITPCLRNYARGQDTWLMLMFPLWHVWEQFSTKIRTVFAIKTESSPQHSTVFRL